MSRLMGQIINCGRRVERIFYTRSAFGKPCTNPETKRFATEEAQQAHNLRISRLQNIRIFHANFGPDSLYTTATLAPGSEKKTEAELVKLRNNYIRALRRACPDAVIAAYSGYGEENGRWHLHLVSNNIPKEILKKKWHHGHPEIKRLDGNIVIEGVVVSNDYTTLANYLFRQQQVDKGKRRYYISRNARRPEVEYISEAQMPFVLGSDKIPGYQLVAEKTVFGLPHQVFSAKVEAPDKKEE